MPLTKTTPPKARTVPPTKAARAASVQKGRLPIGKSPKVAPKGKPKSATKPNGETGTYEGYCVKCKEKGVQFEGEVWENETGNRIAKGKHEKCGTTVCRILGKKS